MNVADLIRGHEGCELRMYICPAGKHTVGVGHNLDDNPISQAAADQILADDIAACRRQLTFNLHWFTELDEVRQAAMLDLCFNLGWAGLGRFRRFLHWMEQKDWSKAAAELVASRWYNQVGNRAPRVKAMIETGAWPA